MSRPVPSSRCVECGAMCWDLEQHERWHDVLTDALARLAGTVLDLDKATAANDLQLAAGVRRLHGLIMGRSV